MGEYYRGLAPGYQDLEKGKRRQEISVCIGVCIGVCICICINVSVSVSVGVTVRIPCPGVAPVRGLLI